MARTRARAIKILLFVSGWFVHAVLQHYLIHFNTLYMCHFCYKANLNTLFGQGLKFSENPRSWMTPKSILSNVYQRTHTHAHARTHTHAHTRTDTHTHTHTHTFGAVLIMINN